MCASDLSVLAPQAQGGGSNLHQTFLGQVGMCLKNFIRLGAGVWISISPPQTNTRTPIFI